MIFWNYFPHVFSASPGLVLQFGHFIKAKLFRKRMVYHQPQTLRSSAVLFRSSTISSSSLISFHLRFAAGYIFGRKDIVTRFNVGMADSYGIIRQANVRAAGNR